MEEEKKEEKKQTKTGFFKRVWYSITKIEKYPDMASEGLGRALGYLARITAILTVILCAGMMYKTYNIVQKGVNYIQNEFPEFRYEDGKINVEAENEIIIPEDKSILGKIIVDTKTEDEQKINQYINDITEVEEGAIILKDRIILKNSSVVGTISYTYKESFESFGVSEFTKQDVINYANSSKIVTLYVSIFLTIFIYAFIMYLLTIISNVVLLSFFGYITTLLARIKMRYVAVFNMSAYALTLSVILNMLYVAVNIFVTFNMEYFQVMYVAVAAIYLVAAILILKADFMKKQLELMKIAEAEAIVKKEMEQEEKDNKEKEERRKKDKEEEKNNREQKKKDKKEKENLGNEAEGSNA